MSYTDMYIVFDANDKPTLAQALFSSPWFRIAPGEFWKFSGNRVATYEVTDVPSDIRALVQDNLSRCSLYLYRKPREIDGIDGRTVVLSADLMAAGLTLRKVPNAPRTTREFFEQVCQLPFHLATWAPHYSNNQPLKHPKSNPDPRALEPSMQISICHAHPGPAIAIRGVGHERLCSRRILDYGPWYIHRDEATDTTVVQFHEDTDDIELAKAQAYEGHKLLAHYYERHIIDQSAYIASNLTFTKVNVTNCYHVTKAFKRATKTEMLDACVMRYHSKVDLARHADVRADEARTLANAPPLDESHQEIIARAAPPVVQGLRRVGKYYPAPLPPDFDNIAFIYTDPADAYADLHELWLRGLRCYAYFDGDPLGARRLDDTYVPPPPPEKPDWVKRLQDQYGK